MKNILLLTFLFFIACTPEKKDLPSESKYKEDTQLMINICTKFSEEPDPAKLHTAAVATQSARVVSCFDFNGECNLYGEFVSMAIQVSADGNISGPERGQLKEKLEELKSAVKDGQAKLKP